MVRSEASVTEEWAEAGLEGVRPAEEPDRAASVVDHQEGKERQESEKAWTSLKFGTAFRPGCMDLAGQPRTDSTISHQRMALPNPEASSRRLEPTPSAIHCEVRKVRW
jgi:hypothetical protein